MKCIELKEEVLKEEKLKLTRMVFSLTDDLSCEELFGKLEEMVYQKVEEKKKSGEIIDSVRTDYSQTEMRIVIEIFCEITE